MTQYSSRCLSAWICSPVHPPLSTSHSLVCMFITSSTKAQTQKRSKKKSSTHLIPFLFRKLFIASFGQCPGKAWKASKREREILIHTKYSPTHTHTHTHWVAFFTQTPKNNILFAFALCGPAAATTTTHNNDVDYDDDDERRTNELHCSRMSREKGFWVNKTKQWRIIINLWVPLFVLRNI